MEKQHGHDLWKNGETEYMEMKESEKWLRHGESCDERGEGQEDNMEGRLFFLMMRPHLLRMEYWPSVGNLEPL